MNNEIIKGTSVSLILFWIKEMKEDIKNEKFYCVKVHNDIFVSSTNKARIIVMDSIFPINRNDNEASMWSGFCIPSESDKENYLKKMLAYFDTIISLLLRIGNNQTR